MSGSQGLQRIRSALPLPYFASKPQEAGVNIGDAVRLLDCQIGAQATLTVVDPEDSKPERGLISRLSPLGESLLGGRVGQVKEVHIFGRRYAYIILGIS